MSNLFRELIPDEFQILGHTVKIQRVDSIDSPEGITHLGYSDYQVCLLSIRNSDDELELCESCIEQTYLHEVVHFILGAMGEDKLNDNEKFVDTFAGLLHQILKTSITREDT